MATDLKKFVEDIETHFENVIHAVTTQIETTETQLKMKLDRVEDRIISTGRNPKVRLWIYIGAGLIIALLIYGVFFYKKGGSLDQSAINERIMWRDSIAAEKSRAEASKAAAIETIQEEKAQLQLENERLTQAFIDNQGKHTTINKKNETINSNVRAIDNEDSLRRAAFGN